MLFVHVCVGWGGLVWYWRWPTIAIRRHVDAFRSVWCCSTTVLYPATTFVSFTLTIASAACSLVDGVSFVLVLQRIFSRNSSTSPTRRRRSIYYCCGSPCFATNLRTRKTNADVLTRFVICCSGFNEMLIIFKGYRALTNRYSMVMNTNRSWAR